MKTAVTVARTRLVIAGSDAEYTKTLINDMAADTPAKIDRVMLLLAGSFCATARRHLEQALSIINDIEQEGEA